MNKNQRFLTRWKDWLLLVVINSLIAIILTLVGNHAFIENMVFAQSIGFSISLLLLMLTKSKQIDSPSIIIVLVSVPLGVVAGMTIGSILLSVFFNVHISNFGSFDKIKNSVAFSLLIGAVVTYYFIQREAKESAEKELIKQQLKEQESKSDLIQTELKLLQAQIEPHFLFNTLSNVISLIDSQPDTAKSMLQSLTQYLRVGLKRTRESDATIGDEVSLLQAYLSIQKIRMGERLNYKINVDETLNAVPLPALIIQPIVENALKHGLEKQIDGGEININVQHSNNQLNITVSDTGAGLQNNKSNGIGLQNVKKRLLSVYGEHAKLTLKNNQPTGVVVQITAPLT